MTTAKRTCGQCVHFRTKPRMTHSRFQPPPGGWICTGYAPHDDACAAFEELTDETKEAEMDKITINGVEYVRADSVAAPAPTGKRAVVVIDRGWIVAGDVTEENGRIYLDRAVWVFRWDDIGFDGVLNNPENPKVKLRPLSHRVDVPEGAEVFRVPVGDSWGL